MVTVLRPLPFSNIFSRISHKKYLNFINTRTFPPLVSPPPPFFSFSVRPCLSICSTLIPCVQIWHAKERRYYCIQFLGDFNSSSSSDISITAPCGRSERCVSPRQWTCPSWPLVHLNIWRFYNCHWWFYLFYCHDQRLVVGHDYCVFIPTKIHFSNFFVLQSYYNCRLFIFTYVHLSHNILRRIRKKMKCLSSYDIMKNKNEIFCLGE